MDQCKSTLNVLGPALLHASSLQLDVKWCREMEEAPVPLQFAAACTLATAFPTLTELVIGGCITKSVLHAFGEVSSALSSINVLRECRWTGDHITDLHASLPHITHVWVGRYFSCREQFVSCQTVTTLSIDNATLTHDIWNALPDGLQHLTCGAGFNGPESHPQGTKQLEQLVSAVFVGDGEEGINAHLVSCYLSRAPALRHVSMSEPGRLYTPLNRSWLIGLEDSPETLTHLHGWHSDASHTLEGGLNLWLIVDHLGQQFLDMQPMPQVNSIFADDNESDHSNQHTQSIIQLFPSISAYALKSSQPVSINELQQLSVLPQLHSLALLSTGGRYTRQLMRDLIPSLRTLQTLHLHHTAYHLCTEDAEHLAKQEYKWLRRRFPHLTVFVSSDQAILQGPGNTFHHEFNADDEYNGFEMF